MQIQWTWLGWEETEREGDKERGGERERAVFSPGCIYEHKKLAPAHLPHLHTQSNSFTVVLVGTLTLSPSPLFLSLSLSAVCQQRLKAKQSSEAQRHQLTIGLPPLTFLVFSLFSFFFFLAVGKLCNSSKSVWPDWHFSRIYAQKTSAKFDVDKGDNCCQLSFSFSSNCCFTLGSLISSETSWTELKWAETTLLTDRQTYKQTDWLTLLGVLYLVMVPCHKLDINMCLLPAQSNQTLNQRLCGKLLHN